MTKVLPYIVFDNALEAIEHYNTYFGDILLERIPIEQEMAEKMGITTALDQTTMHAILNFGGSLIGCSDNMMQEKIAPQRILLDFNMDDEQDVARIKDIYAKVEKNSECQIFMPLRDQFWGGMMGQFKDKYGNIWMLHAQSYKTQRDKSGVLKSFYQ